MNHSEFPPDSWSAVEEIDLREYLAVLQRRRRLILICLTAVVVTTFLFTIAQTPMYRASTTLHIEPDTPKILDFQEMFQVDSTNDAFYQTQYRLIESRGLAERVIDQEGLLDDPSFNGGGGVASWIVGGVLAAPRAAVAMLRSLTSSAPPDEVATEQDVARSKAIDRFLDRLTVSPIRNTRLANISWESPSPQQAARITQTVADTYIAMNLEAKFETTQNAAQFLATEIESLSKQIADKEAELQRYGSERNILGEDDRRDVITAQLSQLNQQLTNARTERVEKEATYQSLRTAVPSSLGEVRTNRVIENLKADLANLRQEYTDLTQRFTDQHPDVQRKLGQISQMEERIGNEERSVYDAVLRQARTTFEAAADQERQLETMLNQATGRASTLNEALIRYRSLQSEIETMRNTLNSLLERQSETGVSARLQGRQTSNIRTIDQAAIPLSPSSPNLRLNLLLGMIVGLMLGVGVAFVQEYLDNSIKSPEDVERHTGLPSLGIVPDIASLAAGGYGGAYSYGHGDYTQEITGTTDIETVTFTQPRSSIAEAYRSLRTSVLLSRAGEPPKVVVVTSSQPGEGKSTSSMNLAIALAQAGKKTLLLDADLRKPRVHGILDLKPDVGIVSFLTGGQSLDQVIIDTRIDNLWALPCGPKPPNPAELLGSDMVKELIKTLRQHFDTIIIDTPPISAVVDPLEMAALADGVLLCVRAGVTPHQMVERSVRKLREIQAHTLGVILNGVDVTGSGYYGKYGKSYRYGGSRSQKRDKKAKAASEAPAA